MSDVRFAVHKYLTEGRVCLPVKPGEKATRLSKWSNPDTKPTDEAFEADSNVAWRLDDLVDVDLDSPEARSMASAILINTECMHGRPSFARQGEEVGITHYWYQPTGDPLKSEQFKDVDGSVIVEIRCGHLQYTLVPPSIVLTKGDAPSPETLAWVRDRPPSSVDSKGLRRSVLMLATAVLLARHWPKGSRHKCALDVAGFLAARDLDRREAEEIIRQAVLWAKDDELGDRLKAVQDTFDTFKAGGKTSGGPTLEASIGKEAVALLLKWYGGNNAVHDGVVEEMNKRHFYVRVGKDTVVGTEEGDEIIFQAEKALYSWYANQVVAIGTKSKGEGKGQPITRTKFDIWREHPKRRQFRRVTFAPQPRKAHPEDYNLWRGLAIAPAEGTCTMFLEHIKVNLCGGNEMHFEYLMNLLAFTVQQPGTPSEVAVVLKGQQGTGKGIFARNFGAIFGRHYVQLDRSEHLTGKFNSSVSGKVVVFADEAFFAGDKAHIGTLKRITTEPTLQIERKGIDATPEPNCMHLIMATNEDWAIPAGMNERRFLVLEVSDLHMQDHAYFDLVQQELDGGGLAAFLKLLLERPVTHGMIRRVPLTSELRRQQEHTMAAEYKWLKECLDLGEFERNEENRWPDHVDTTALFDLYLMWCDRMKINRRITQTDFSRRVMAPYLGKPFRPIHGNPDRKRMRPILTLEKSREAFDKIFGTVTPWEAVEEEAPGALLPEERQPGDETAEAAGGPAPGGKDDLPF